MLKVLQAHLTVLSPNAGKYGPENLRITDTFYAMSVSCKLLMINFNISKFHQLGGTFQLINLTVDKTWKRSIKRSLA